MYPFLCRSKLRVRVRAEDQGRIITCEADNGLGVTVATNITLDVLRKCLPPFATDQFIPMFEWLSCLCNLSSPSQDAYYSPLVLPLSALLLSLSSSVYEMWRGFLHPSSDITDSLSSWILGLFLYCSLSHTALYLHQPNSLSILSPPMFATLYD